jgi:hypothetical protein
MRLRYSFSKAGVESALASFRHETRALIGGDPDLQFSARCCDIVYQPQPLEFYWFMVTKSNTLLHSCVQVISEAQMISASVS